MDPLTGNANEWDRHTQEGGGQMVQSIDRGEWLTYLCCVPFAPRPAYAQILVPHRGMFPESDAIRQQLERRVDLPSLSGEPRTQRAKGPARPLS